MPKSLENPCKCNGTGVVQAIHGYELQTGPCDCELGKVTPEKDAAVKARLQAILDDIAAKRKQTA